MSSAETGPPLMLQGKVAVVTGAASGIGRSTCVALAREGTRVALADVNDAGVAETLSLLQPGGEPGAAHLPLHLDVTDEEAVEVAVRAVTVHFGRPADVVVNCAGIVGPSKPLLDLDVADMRTTFTVNAEGTFLVMRAFVRALRDAGWQGGGSVVNVSSVGAVKCIAQFGHYTASKAAVSVLTKTAAREWAPLGVRCNAVLPGFVNTPLLPPERKEFAKSLTSLGRWAQPEEIAEVIVFLASDKSSYMTGAEVPVTGGVFGGT